MSGSHIHMRRLSIAFMSLCWLIACGSPAPIEPPVASRPDIPLPRELTVVRGVVPRHATLDAMLREHGVAGEVVHAVIAAARGAFDPRRLKSLQPFALERTIDGALSMFEYEIDADWFLRVKPEEDTRTLQIGRASW